MPPVLKKKDLFVFLLLCMAYMTALAIYNAFQDLSSLFRKLPSKRRRQEVITYDTSIKVDPTAVLPVEIVQQILSLLPPGTYLNTKFVSRAFNAATLLFSGGDLCNFKGTRDHKDPNHEEYLRAVITLEAAHTGPPLNLLTCYYCGKRLGKSVAGFCDEEFVQARYMRSCMTCHVLHICTVKGVVIERCFECNRYVPVERSEGESRECRAVKTGHRCASDMMRRQ